MLICQVPPGSARFERPDDAPGLLRAQATLEEYGNGSCIGCAYRPPEQVALPGTITLTFDQRNHGTYRIDGGEAIHIAPLAANSVFADEFADQMHYALPDPEGMWVLTFKAEAGEGNEFKRIASVSGVFGARNVRATHGHDEPYKIDWTFMAMPPRSESYPAAQLYCTGYGDGSPPTIIPVECKLLVQYASSMFPEFGSSNGIRFPLPYANIGDGRIVSEDPETGVRLEAFRIGHD